MRAALHAALDRAADRHQRIDLYRDSGKRTDERRSVLPEHLLLGWRSQRRQLLRIVQHDDAGTEQHSPARQRIAIFGGLALGMGIFVG